VRPKGGASEKGNARKKTASTFKEQAFGGRWTLLDGSCLPQTETEGIAPKRSGLTGQKEGANVVLRGGRSRKDATTNRTTFRHP